MSRSTQPIPIRQSPDRAALFLRHFTNRNLPKILFAGGDLAALPVPIGKQPGNETNSVTVDFFQGVEAMGMGELQIIENRIG